MDGGNSVVSLKDLSKRCGCSVSTVSRAFSNPDIVKEETKHNIFSVAEEMGYTPNALARSLKNTHSQTIGIIIPSINNLFYIEVLKNIELELHKRDYKLIVSFLQPGIIDERAALEPIVSARVDGIIIFSDNRDNERYFKRIDKQIRIVQLFTRPYDEYDSIVIRDADGMELAADCLLKRGHRRILYFGFSDRVEGYRRAYRKRGFPVPEELIYIEDRPLTAEIFSEALQDHHPTAVLTCSLNSQTAIQTMIGQKIRIPEDISFISYDDSNWARIMGITVIAHPLETVTEHVVNTLLERIHCPQEGGITPVRIEIMPYLIERKSVRYLHSQADETRE